jgi:hypothetical protein
VTAGRLGGGASAGGAHEREIIKQARWRLNPVMLDIHIAGCRDQGVKAMMRFKALLIAAPVAAALLAAPAAQAEWRGGHGGGWHGGGWHGGGWHGGGWHGDYHRGPGIGGALLGLGAAAVIGGVIASQAYAPPPPVYYAPPPAYYAPPPPYYAAPPGYYAAPPGYYPPPGY